MKNLTAGMVAAVLIATGIQSFAQAGLKQSDDAFGTAVMEGEASAIGATVETAKSEKQSQRKAACQRGIAMLEEVKKVRIPHYRFVDKFRDAGYVWKLSDDAYDRSALTANADAAINIARLTCNANPSSPAGALIEDLKPTQRL